MLVEEQFKDEKLREIADIFESIKDTQKWLETLGTVSLLDKNARKECISGKRKIISILNKNKQKINALKRQLKKTESKYKKQRIEDKTKKQIAEKIFEIIRKDIEEKENTLNEVFKMLNTIYKPTKIWQIDRVTNYIMICLMAFTVAYSVLVKNNLTVNIFVNIVVCLLMILFAIWKIFYIPRYLKYIQADLKTKISVWLLKGSTVLLQLCFCFTFMCFWNDLRPTLSAISLLIITILKITGYIYDFFASENLLTVNEIAWLVISVIITLTLTGIVVENAVIQLISKILLVMVSLLLTAIILKSFFLDKPEIKEYSTIFHFIMILTVTIALSILALYVLFWNKDSGDQPLFTAIVGVYGAVVGGALTLGGVAWTIRKADIDRKENDIIHATPYLQVINYNRKDVEYKRMVNIEEMSGGIYFPFVVTNIGLELCFIKYVQSNEKFVPVNNGYIASNDIMRLNLHLKTNNVQALIVSDRMSNYYRFELNVVNGRIDSIGLPQKFDITTIGETK